VRSKNALLKKNAALKSERRKGAIERLLDIPIQSSQAMGVTSLHFIPDLSPVAGKTNDRQKNRNVKKEESKG
jgi:hypothetical protein